MYSFVENTPVFFNCGVLNKYSHTVLPLAALDKLSEKYISSIIRANLETPIIVTYLGGSYYKFNSLYTDCFTNKLIFLGEL